MTLKLAHFCILGLMLTTIAPISRAGTEPLSYKGFPIGGSLSIFKQRLPDFICGDNGECRYESAQCEKVDSAAACEARTSFAGQRVISGHATFRDGRVSFVMLVLANFSIDLAAEIATKKFGQPSERGSDAQGLTPAKWRKIWYVGGNIMEITDYGQPKFPGVVALNYMLDAVREREEKLRRGLRDF